MTEIQTIPVTADEPAEAEPAEPAVAEPAPKRRGRPVGSKSKEPGKPRAPRKAKVVVEPVEVEPVVEVEPERILPGSRPIPTEAHDSRTAMMLELLQLQANERRRRKVDLYRSWFRQ